MLPEQGAVKTAKENVSLPTCQLNEEVYIKFRIITLETYEKKTFL